MAKEKIDYKTLPWSDVPGMALKNFGPSLGQLAKDTVRPILEPVETAKSIGNLALGLYQKITPGVQPNEAMVDAVGDYFKNRYFTVDGFKQAVAEDPAGVLADVSTVLTGGGSALAKAPGMVGKVGSALARAPGMVGKVGRSGAVAKAPDMVGRVGRGMLAMDPIGLAGKGIRAASASATGLGMDVAKEAYEAGVRGGKSGKAFRQNMRGKVPTTQLVDDVERNIEKMAAARRKAYKDGMFDVRGDASVLNDGFDDILDTYFNKINENTIGTGVRNEGAAKALDAVGEILNEWTADNPAVRLTPDGIDTLKKRVGELINWQTRTTSENVAIKEMYDKIADTLKTHSPKYAEVMSDYQKATDQLMEIRKTLGMKEGGKTNVDSALRKITSTLRNNVNTNFGRRGEVLRELEKTGGVELAPSVAGQAASGWLPRGIQGGMTPLTAGVGMAASGSPAGLLAPILQSPRLNSEVLHAAGRVPVRGGLLTSFQAGRAADPYFQEE